jgi:TM2 domain-containing membrane protein YozV
VIEWTGISWIVIIWRLVPNDLWLHGLLFGCIVEGVASTVVVGVGVVLVVLVLLEVGGAVVDEGEVGPFFE